MDQQAINLAEEYQTNLEQISVSTYCPVCCQVFCSDQVLVLGCFHSLCHSCLKAVLDGYQTDRCPICRLEIDLDKTMPVFSQFMEEMETMVLSQIERDAIIAKKLQAEVKRLELESVRAPDVITDQQISDSSSDEDYLGY